MTPAIECSQYRLYIYVRTLSFYTGGSNILSSVFAFISKLKTAKTLVNLKKAKPSAVKQ